MKKSNRRFTRSLIKELKHYVYLYSHPKTGEIFYIGQGEGNRVFAHLEEKSESEKSRYIQNLRSQGLEPKIEILIHGLNTKYDALRVESSVIDLIGINKLTNKQSGYKSESFGRMSLKQISSKYHKQEIKITEPSVLIRISKAFRYTMSDIELYDYTRGQWKINPARAKKARYGFAIYEGIVQEVYEIIRY